jgi:hypothetical protein
MIITISARPHEWNFGKEFEEPVYEDKTNPIYSPKRQYFLNCTIENIKASPIIRESFSEKVMI